MGLLKRLFPSKERAPSAVTTGETKPKTAPPAPPGSVYVQEKWDAVQIGDTWHQVYELKPTEQVSFGFARHLLLNASLALNGKAAWVVEEIAPGDFKFDWFTRQRLKRIEITTTSESGQFGHLADDRESGAGESLHELWEAHRSGEPLTRWRLLAGVQAPTYAAVKQAGGEMLSQGDMAGITVRLLKGDQWPTYRRVWLSSDPTNVPIPKGRLAPLSVSSMLIPFVGAGATDAKSKDGHSLIYFGHRLADGRKMNLDIFSGVQDSNIVICGKTGSGKSTFMKALIQSLCQAGCRIVVLDLDGEGHAQCNELGGVWMDLSAATGRYIDPLLLPPAVEVPSWLPEHQAKEVEKWNTSRLSSALESVMGFLSILLGDHWRRIAEIPSVANDSIQLTFERVGIDPEDDTTWNRPCTMLDWWETLKDLVSTAADPMVREPGNQMIFLLKRYFEGKMAMFREPVSLSDSDAIWIHMAGAMGQGMADQQATTAKMQLALTTLWAVTVQERIKGIRFTALFFDEGQRLLTNPEAAATVASLVTGVRKFNALTILATNMPQVFWRNEGGKAAWQNSSYRVLFGLEDNARKEIREANPDESGIAPTVLQRLGSFGVKGTSLAHAYMYRHPVKGWEECVLKLPADELELYLTRGLRKQKDEATSGGE